MPADAGGRWSWLNMKMSVDDGSDEVVMLRDRAVSGVEEAASKGARLAEEASISISLSGTRRAA